MLSQLLSVLHTCLVATPPLYGLALVANGPAKVALARINATTGNATVIGPAHGELFGMGDLVATAHGALFYLGDTGSGATLVALNLTTGSELCSAHVDVAEIQFVGIGQSLDHDPTTDSLILSGLTTNQNGSHAVYRAPDIGCGPFEHIGNFGYGDYAPMLHASALDAHGQRLFVTLAPSDASSAIGVIDLAAGGAMTIVDEAATPDLHDTLLCMHYDAHTGRLVGVLAAQSLELHQLDPATQTWEAARALGHVPARWNALGGNAATVSALDVAARTLHLLAGASDPFTGALALDLGAVDVDTAQVTAHPPLAPVGMPGCATCLLAMSF